MNTPKTTLQRVKTEFSTANAKLLSGKAISLTESSDLLFELGLIRLNAKATINALDDHELNQLARTIFNNSTRSIRHILNSTGEQNASNLHEFNRIILNTHRGGLCNRLRSIAALAALPIEIEKYFLWIPDDACDVEVSEIFPGLVENAYFEVRSLDFGTYSRYMASTGTRFTNDLSTAWSYWNQNRPYSGKWEDFQSKYTKACLRISECASPNVSKHAREIARSHHLNTAIGWHIRRGDFTQYYRDKFGQELPSTADLSAYISEYHANSQIYICCDDSEFQTSLTEKLIQSNLIKNVSFAPREMNGSKLRETSVQQAFIDILCLSECSAILGTQGSSFSEFSATLRCAREQRAFTGMVAHQILAGTTQLMGDQLS